MSSLISTDEIINSLEDYTDVVSWINDTLSLKGSEDEPSKESIDLSELDQHITHLVATLDITCEDTSSQLERIIDDVSRGVPRLTYDLHFMKDGALSLQAALAEVHDRSRDSIPPATGEALDRLQLLHTIKGRMEAAREVLREAESWSSLESEVTSLLTEQSYAKAAERLSEASKSMVIFQNTPDYEPRRTLMVSLQNQLEASLSSALVAAINTQDAVVCRNYFSIFSNIQRESEFRNYYNGSRRAPIVTLWQNSHLLDCDSVVSSTDSTSSTDSISQVFTGFLSKFFSSFVNLLNQERTSIPLIFPDPPLTLSALISSTLSSLQPSFSQRLSSLFVHYGASALKEIIIAYKLTEDFAASVGKIMEKIKYSAVIASPIEAPVLADSSQPSQNTPSHRRRSTRMSISWRPSANRSSSSGLNVAKASFAPADGLDWDQELFQPFIDFQVDYGSLERHLLEDALNEIVTSDTTESDRARLLRERAVDIIGVAEESVTRCITFTHGYAAVGLVQALDHYFGAFIDMWTADISTQSKTSATSMRSPTSSGDLSDLDYTAQDWSNFQLSLHLLASARTVYERMSTFETKLRSHLVQIATKFRLARNDPSNFSNTRGGNQLLEQSVLNSAELHNLLSSVDPDSTSIRESSTSNLRHQPPMQSGSSASLLVNSRAAVFSFAKACQVSLQSTILSPLRNHLASYASSSLWTTPGDPKLKHTVSGSMDLRVPNFSLSPSDTVQRVAEGLLNLPRLFEVYVDDDALSFSLQTLPHVDAELSTALPEQPADALSQVHTHLRRASLSTKLTHIDPEAVSSAWLASLGHSLLSHLTTSVLPTIPKLTVGGAAQLSSDLGYLSNIVRALNVEFEELEKWKEYVDLEDDEGRQKVVERDLTDQIFRHVARMRGWIQ